MKEMRATRYVPIIDGQPGGWRVWFPDAPACAAVGPTAVDALRDGFDAVAAWLDYREAEDIPAPDPRTVDELLNDPEVKVRLAGGAKLVEM
ncbi:type II toxin-antitoxin system HicB family antitoxin [Mesorhizobium sp.]|uniref:type II toxin-antitoxin system HicB family antitoxin n=1 Tax=Mesorhizobium sp. TaxID=1871066 RepID=UPI00120775BA|nr:type II toxin-antitoxin system HicB family antitoxin [Mesorhizobium sp.]TIO10946.1 MAG: HicB family protein [Mesorhizobium sp.]TIO32932.1 MAG: HicB family protein [Mesorhizobium sp.]